MAVLLQYRRQLIRLTRKHKDVFAAADGKGGAALTAIAPHVALSEGGCGVPTVYKFDAASNGMVAVPHAVTDPAQQQQRACTGGAGASDGGSDVDGDGGGDGDGDGGDYTLAILTALRAACKENRNTSIEEPYLMSGDADFLPALCTSDEQFGCQSAVAGYELWDLPFHGDGESEGDGDGEHNIVKMEQHAEVPIIERVPATKSVSLPSPARSPPSSSPSPSPARQPFIHKAKPSRLLRKLQQSRTSPRSSPQRKHSLLSRLKSKRFVVGDVRAFVAVKARQRRAQRRNAMKLRAVATALTSLFAPDGCPVENQRR